MRIQFGCTQTVLDNTGRLVCYRGSLPVHKGLAHSNPAIKLIKGKAFYMPESQDFEELWRLLDDMRIVNHKFKIKELNQRIKQIKKKSTW